MNDNRQSLPSLEQCVESIEAAYARLGHQLGWRFLVGPRRTFTADTRFAFITLNPGGKHENLAHPRSSSENGSAYWIESWKARRHRSAAVSDSGDLRQNSARRWCDRTHTRLRRDARIDGVFCALPVAQSRRAASAQGNHCVRAPALVRNPRLVDAENDHDDRQRNVSEPAWNHVGPSSDRAPTVSDRLGTLHSGGPPLRGGRASRGGDARSVAALVQVPPDVERDVPPASPGVS